MVKSSAEIEGGGMADTWITIDRKARNCLYFLPGKAPNVIGIYSNLQPLFSPLLHSSNVPDPYLATNEGHSMNMDHGMKCSSNVIPDG